MLATLGRVAEVIEERDRTPAGMDGWKHEYRIRRDDGEEVTVRTRCPDTVAAIAAVSPDQQVRQFVGDRGRLMALAAAESAQAGRGVSISLLATPYGVKRESHYPGEPEVT